MARTDYRICPAPACGKIFTTRSGATRHYRACAEVKALVSRNYEAARARKEAQA